MNECLKTGRREALICLLLAAAVWGVFGQTGRFDFVNYDDGLYVYEAPAVLQGLTPAGVKYAFTSRLADGWYPLTTMSLMLDATLYGDRPGGFHLTNVLLHMAAALALFLALRSLTGSVWRSAFTAAVFAVHPLRAESVAWISARKDVLSGLFFFLTLWAYARYARVAGGACRVSRVGWYVTVVFLFTCGLMSKPMVITLPCVLLLLDYWPLRRMAQKSEDRGRKTEFKGQESRDAACHAPLSTPYLILEKLPLFALAIMAAAGTTLAEQAAVISEKKLPFLLRAGNALRSYAAYIVQTVWPAKLTPFYPHPARGISGLEIGLSLILLLAVSAAVLRWRKKCPWLLTGWLWYLGVLVPVSGLMMQAGSQAHADRYTYLPHAGLLLAAVWTAASVLAAWRHRTVRFSLSAAVILAGLAVKAHAQTAIWRDGYALWTHTVRCMQDNTLACYNLAEWLMRNSRPVEAENYLNRALGFEPDNTDFLFSMGNAVSAQGRLEDSIPYYEKAVRLNPGYFQARMNLGGVLLRAKQPEKAAAVYEEAVRIRPDDEHARLLFQMAARDARVRRDHPGVLDDLHRQAVQTQKEGNVTAAAALYRQALELHPWHISSLNNLAWILATSTNAALRDGVKAVEMSEMVNKLSDGKTFSLMSTLAAAYAEAGRFADAVAVSQRALKQARMTGDAAQIKTIEERVELYRKGLPLRQ